MEITDISASATLACGHCGYEAPEAFMFKKWSYYGPENYDDYAEDHGIDRMECPKCGKK